ncbi:alpha/beta hydrolase [Marinovum sp. 2_MG-2023]|uniref:alpha/beta hydrolase n=1 Tax=unclassified Marinovum TaxID=2647166 RepID=UPI0026E15928|nr:MULTISPECIES: alpha/beta hydrolase [unclassified Marinovum]MDO6731360.1 alpha/beta hydrolase [Marinovum sp. 2_MG-2023]MDO6780741.1 alpha/beta hydrolase [Marinovum sp. 1_MG-2023]
MAEHRILDTEQGRHIAYHKAAGQGPTVVFLGGFKSDMAGTKAVWLEDWCRAKGRAFLRFDYSGHGVSSGAFEDGCIGDWAEDAEAVIRATCDGPLVLVGSSMGGWISLLMAQRLGNIAGMVTIAAAPDFTEDGFWASFGETERDEVMQQGYRDVPSEYGDPYRITRRLIEDGRTRLVLRSPLALPFPVRCMQGTNDTAVTRDTALRLLDHADCPDISLTFLKGADHSFSAPDCLPLIARAIDEVSGL